MQVSCTLGWLSENAFFSWEHKIYSFDVNQAHAASAAFF